MPATAYAHIEVRNGVPCIEGTRTRVVMVAPDRIAHGWSAEEIHEQYPHLTLGQIHSALAYYYDHREELDRVIEERQRQAEAMRQQHDQTGLREMLEARRRQHEAQP